MDKFIVVRGERGGNLSFAGPFDSFQQAVEWGENFTDRGEQWFAAPIYTEAIKDVD